MAQIIKDVAKGKLHSAHIFMPFDKAKEALESEGYRIISLEEQAGLRMQEGAGTPVSFYGNWVREGVIYIPKKGVFLTKNSSVLDDARKAINQNREVIDFSLTDEQIEKSLADSVSLPADIVSKIPTDRFADDKITAYAFGKEAKKYGKFLKRAGLDSIKVHVCFLKDKPFVRQLWLGGLADGNNSSLSGLRYLYDGERVRGIQ